MRNDFLKIFSKSGVAEELIDNVLQPMLEEAKDVTTGEFGNATNGEIFVGKKIAADMIQTLIHDIHHYKEEKVRVKDPKDQMN